MWESPEGRFIIIGTDFVNKQGKTVLKTAIDEKKDAGRQIDKQINQNRNVFYLKCFIELELLL